MLIERSPEARAHLPSDATSSLESEILLSARPGVASYAQRQTAEGLCSLRLEVTRRKILQACAAAGRSDSAKALARWAAPQHAAWIPEIGQSLARLQEGDLDRAIVQLAIAFALCGASLPEVEADTDAPLLVNGSWRRLGKGSGLAAQFAALAPQRPPRQREAVAPGVARPYLIDFGGTLHADRFPWPPQEPAAVGRSIGQVSNILDEAIGLIGSVMPEMLDWLGIGMRGILVFDVAEGERFRSGSDFQLPGLIGISSNCSVVQVAECLVHECAHQLMHMASMRIRFTDASLGEMLYSPVRGEHRPTVRVLLGAHAVATIGRFYAVLRRDSQWATLATERFEYFSGWMNRDYMPALDTSTALTPEGRRFWQELKAEY